MTAAPCPACASTDLEELTVAPTETTRGREILRCRECATMRLLHPSATIVNRSGNPRLGHGNAYGRDLPMTTTGLDILGRRDVRLLWWRAGCSTDLPRIAGSPLLSEIAVWDDADLCGVGEAGRRDAPDRGAHDLVVGNEVVQGLDDPEVEWGQLFGAVSADGLVVLSTDLTDDSDPAEIGFVRAPLHKWMWSYEGLRRLGDAHGFRLDVRLPQVARVNKLRRKRFLYLSRSAQTMERVRCYFGRTPFAPSEDLG